MNRPESFSNICPVFTVDDVRKTTQFYVEKLGFKYAHHFDKVDNFATVYRDDIEIVLVQKSKGEVVSNQARYGNGYDAYIDTQELEGVDILYEEYRENGVKIISAPHMTDYGSYEFVFEDIDGRRIGIGLIAKQEVYFAESNYFEDSSSSRPGGSMALEIMQIEYYNITVEDQMTGASKLLSAIAGAGVDFHAFRAIPVEPNQIRFTLFAKNSATMTAGARKAGLTLDGPYAALLIKGDEKSGALAGIYEKLAHAGIQVGEAYGIADINAGYGIILYLEQEDCGKALAVLKM